MKTRRKPVMTLPPTRTAADVQTEWKREGAALPWVTRQDFLDRINAGEAIGLARAAVGITFEAAMGIISSNIETREFLQLRKTAA